MTDEQVKKFTDWLDERIRNYDRAVDATTFTVDQQLYNQMAHLLRYVKETLKEIIKKGG